MSIRHLATHVAHRVIEISVVVGILDAHHGSSLFHMIDATGLGVHLFEYGPRLRLWQIIFGIMFMKLVANSRRRDIQMLRVGN